MSVAIEQAAGRYIYGIMRASNAPALGVDAPVGLDDQSLEIIKMDGVAAVVSPSEICRLRPQRRLLAAHQRVVNWLAQYGGLLPVAFGLIADSDEDVERLLEKHQEVLSEQLTLVDGRVEMTMALKWSAENIFQYFVEQSDELRAARDKVASGEASREEMIEVGRMFEGLLTCERERLTELVLQPFNQLAVSIDQQPPKQEAEILRAAFLIEKADVDLFEKSLYEVAAQFNEEFSFSFNGPWPPYSFVKLNLASE